MKKFFRWLFKAELKILEDKIKLVDTRHDEYLFERKKLQEILSHFDVSVDHHKASSRSWAVISCQGKKDFIRFVDLGESDIREIQRFLSNFDRRKVDAGEDVVRYLRGGYFY
jgi:hypothetical protein